MLIRITVYSLSLFADLILAILVISKKNKNKLNKIFLFFILSITSWLISLFLFYELTNPILVLFLGRINFAVVVLIGYFFVIFSSEFSKEYNKFTKIQLLFFQILTIILFITTIFTPLIDKTEIIQEESRITIYGKLYWFFIVYFLTCASVGITLIIIKYKRTTILLEKIQTRLLLLGILTSFVLSSLSNIFIPLLTGFYDIQQFGPLATTFLIASIAYSIIRYRFLDIRLAIRSTIVKLMYILILSGIGALGTYLYDLLPGITVDKRAYFLVLILVSVFVFIGEFILKNIIRLTDKFFFQSTYTEQEALNDLGKTMVKSIDLETLSERIKNSLKKVFHVHFVSILIFSEDKFKCFGDKSNKTFLTKDNLLIKRILKKPEILILDEIKLIKEEQNEASEDLEKLIKAMSDMEAQVVFPLYGTEKIIGIIILGEKKSNEAFTINNVQAIDTLSYQAGIAIENANLYSEVRNFSHNLQKEVHKATSDLKERNKFLNILRKLDSIIMNTFDLDLMCQKIADTVTWEVGYAGAMICLIDETKNLLRFKAFSKTPDFEMAFSNLPQPLKKIQIPMSEKGNPLIKSLLESPEIAIYDKLSDIFSPYLAEKVCAKIQTQTKIKTYIIKTLSAKGKKLGILILGLFKTQNEISEREYELIQAFTDQTGIAIENSQLYSDLKVSNDNLEKANVHLTELDKMKDEFVSIASHELRTPMTAIRGFAWMLQSGKHKAEFTPRQKDYLDKISQSSDRLIALVSDMLDVSRIEGGRVELEFKEQEIENLIESCLEEIKPQALDKNIILSFDKNSQALPKVIIDERRIREVLINLIGNAIKFTPPAGKVTVSAHRKGKFVQIHVIDTGRGIERKDISKLFKKFSRLEHSFALVSETSGTGLGLYISRALIELHGGKISVKSKLGEGSDFYFTVRVAK